MKKTIIPAIDLCNSRCVRLRQGDFNQKKIYDIDPVEAAKQFVEFGAKRLHIVDLDATFSRGNNRGVISDIIKAISSSDCIVEVSGGIRSKQDVKSLLVMGAHRLTLGTVVINNFFEVQEWISEFGQVFVASIDCKDSMVRIAGWLEDSNITDYQFLAQLKKLKLCSINYTNITKDGTLSGIDEEKGNEIAEKAHVPVVIAGGVDSIEGIREIMNKGHRNVSGIIVGKAYYEGDFDMKKAFEEFPCPKSSYTTW